MKKNMKKWIALLLACAVSVQYAPGAFAADLDQEPPSGAAVQEDPSSAPEEVPQADPSTDPSTAPEEIPQVDPSTDPSAAPEEIPQVDPSTDPSTAPEEVQQVDNTAVDAAGQQGEVTEPITKEDKPYLALGANLTAQQQAVVLGLLGINPAELADYDVIYITNEEEHRYLGNYVSADKIGTRSLSSVLIVKREEGHGINITTKNISYCTIGMYKNALITAGITDADIIVAGPSPISGTAALVGAMKAYSDMTGEEVSDQSMDTALNELVLTGDLADAAGDSEKAEEFVAYLKQEILSRDLSDEEDIREAIDMACEKYDFTLSEEETAQLVSLLKKIGSLDLDLDSITKQAQDLYDRIANIDAGGFLDKIAGFFKSIADFFKGLFS